METLMEVFNSDNESDWITESDDDSDWMTESETSSEGSDSSSSTSTSESNSEGQSDSETESQSETSTESDSDLILHYRDDDFDISINLNTDLDPINLDSSADLDGLHYIINTSRPRAPDLNINNNHAAIEAPSTTKNNNQDKVCPICYELCTCESDHCLAFIRCGHFFGKSCIRKWFLEYRKKKCPICKTKSNVGDLQ